MDELSLTGSFIAAAERVKDHGGKRRIGIGSRLVVFKGLLTGREDSDKTIQDQGEIFGITYQALQNSLNNSLAIH